MSVTGPTDDMRLMSNSVNAEIRIWSRLCCSRSGANQSEPDTWVNQSANHSSSAPGRFRSKLHRPCYPCGIKASTQSQADHKRYGCAQRRTALASPKEFQPTRWFSRVRHQQLAPPRPLTPISTPRLSPLTECKLLYSSSTESEGEYRCAGRVAHSRS